MKESAIRNLALLELRSKGYKAVWFPQTTSYRYRQDIFGIFDLVVAKDTEVSFIQLTTKHHVSDRHNKIVEYFSENNCWIPNSYIWGYDDEKNQFDIYSL